MRAQATASFEFAKIGLNVHHPILGLAGRRWSGIAGGTQVGGVMPERIYPQVELRDLGLHVPMIPPVSELTLDQQAGTLRFDFGGDLYETEDQRNWSDASYKTYSMPAFTGYQHWATEGEEFVQQVRLEFEPREERPRLARRRSAGPPAEDPGRLELGPRLGRAVPAVGLGFSEAVGAAEDERFAIAAASPPAPRPRARRRRLGGRGSRRHWPACAKLGAGLELALFTAGDPRGSARLDRRRPSRSPAPTSPGCIVFPARGGGHAGRLDTAGPGEPADRGAGRRWHQPVLQRTVSLAARSAPVPTDLLVAESAGSRLHRRRPGGKPRRAG